MEPMRMATYGRNGKEWELKAKSAHGYSNHNLIFLDQMKVVTYDRGREATTIEAQEGIFNRKLGIPYKPGEGDFLTGIPKLMEGDLFMQNGVVIVSTDGTKLMTDWMHFHNKDDLVTSTAPVKIIRDDSITEGTGMKAKPDLSKVEIYNETLIIKGDE
jgi:lipopolysaccharide export system protein LptC